VDVGTSTLPNTIDELMYPTQSLPRENRAVFTTPQSVFRH